MKYYENIFEQIIPRILVYWKFFFMLRHTLQNLDDSIYITGTLSLKKLASVFKSSLNNDVGKLVIRCILVYFIDTIHILPYSFLPSKVILRSWNNTGWWIPKKFSNCLNTIVEAKMINTLYYLYSSFNGHRS